MASIAPTTDQSSRQHHSCNAGGTRDVTGRTCAPHGATSGEGQRDHSGKEGNHGRDSPGTGKCARTASFVLVESRTGLFGQLTMDGPAALLNELTKVAADFGVAVVFFIANPIGVSFGFCTGV